MAQRDAYEAALREVTAKGGAAGMRSTTRTPEETLIGMYWAYDGAAGIGTPPRLYNQLVRRIEPTGPRSRAQNARLLALVNAAMGDAGKFAWREKYRYDLWRPVLGIREYDASVGPDAVPDHHINERGNPFWLPLGSPRTNQAGAKSFSPNFPAYPSGHATFGAAALQMVRRYHGVAGTGPLWQQPDTVGFHMVSDELNGVSTDGAGTVRVRHEREFHSIWEAIHENALSRIFLGVHWSFDAFAADDVRDDHGHPKNPAAITYEHQVGGVKLGLDIANDIFGAGLVAPPR